MKFISTTICCLLFAATVHSQTLNWGNEILGQVVDSNGVEVDNTFLFELGAFDSGFTPTQANISQWYDNWNVFDYTTYDTNPLNDRFTSTVFIEYDAGHPDAPNVALSGNRTGVKSDRVSSMNFSGLQAYIWVRKGDQPIVGSEWLLVSASDWDFPTQGQGCCSGLPWEWSTSSDLDATTPLWGRQHDVVGPGVGVFDVGDYDQYSPTLQTFTFIPEPGSFVMSALAAVGLLLRRRRPVEESV